LNATWDENFAWSQMGRIARRSVGLMRRAGVWRHWLGMDGGVLRTPSTCRANISGGCELIRSSPPRRHYYPEAFPNDRAGQGSRRNTRDPTNKQRGRHNMTNGVVIDGAIHRAVNSTGTLTPAYRVPSRQPERLRLAAPPADEIERSRPVRPHRGIIGRPPPGTHQHKHLQRARCFRTWIPVTVLPRHQPKAAASSGVALDRGREQNGHQGSISPV